MKPEPILPIGGWQALTTVDFPGYLSAVVFCQGCPWRCRYCHNAHLQDFTSSDAHFNWDTVAGLLLKRKGFLEAVVFSGGEPTAHAGLAAAITECRRMDYRIGLHTAGIYPDKLKELLPLVDWVGFDVKAPLDDRYDRVTLVRNSADAVKRSLALLKESGIDHQIRITHHPALLSSQDLNDIRKEMRLRGLHAPIIQTFRPEGCADRDLTSSGIKS